MSENKEIDVKEVQPKYNVDDVVAHQGFQQKTESATLALGGDEQMSMSQQKIVRVRGKIDWGTIENIEWYSTIGFMYHVTNPYAGLVMLREDEIYQKVK
jgi:hypothetical protein